MPIAPDPVGSRTPRQIGTVLTGSDVAVAEALMTGSALRESAERKRLAVLCSETVICGDPSDAVARDVVTLSGAA